MEKDEVFAVFKSGEGVVSMGVEYKEISALIYRKRKNKRGATEIVLSVELLDKSGRGVTITDPRFVERIKKHDV